MADDPYIERKYIRWYIRTAGSAGQRLRIPIPADHLLVIERICSVNVRENAGAIALYRDYPPVQEGQVWYRRFNGGIGTTQRMMSEELNVCLEGGKEAVVQVSNSVGTWNYWNVLVTYRHEMRPAVGTEHGGANE